MSARHPDIVQVTKTEDTPFEQFREQKIRVVNDDWSTPLDIIRSLMRSSVPIREVSSFQRVVCTGFNGVGT